MAGTNSVAAKKAIIAKLQAAPELASLQVTYSFPGNIELSCIYGGRIRFDQDPMSFVNPATGRITREETATITLVLVVMRPDKDQAQADTDVAALSAVVENLLASNWTLDGQVMAAVVRSGDIEPMASDDACASQLTLDVMVTSELN